MANKKRNVYKPKPMTDGKRNLIQGLLQEYDIESAEDIQDALKDLLSGTIQGMLESEMNEHLGYDKYERSEEPNYRNGTKPKSVRSKYGEFEVDVPQDRQSTFEPQVVPKRKKDISGIEDKIISLYAKGMTTTQISEMIEDIYGFEISEGMVSDITDKLLPQIEEWQNRPLSDVYPIVFIDAIHFSVRDDGIIRKLAAYVVLGINGDGYKEVMTIEIGENESSKYWLGVLNSLKKLVKKHLGFHLRLKNQARQIAEHQSRADPNRARLKPSHEYPQYAILLHGLLYAFPKRIPKAKQRD